MSDIEHHKHTHTSGSSSGVSQVIFGMVLGAVITYLFTNKEGQKVREVLLKEGTRLLDEFSKKAQSIEDHLHEEQVGRELAEKIETVKKGVEEIEQIVEDVPNHIEQIQKKGRRFFSRRHSTES